MSQIMGEQPHIRVELLSDPNYLAGVRQLIAGVTQRVGFDEKSCSQVALAVDEALANVIRHGYSRACDRPIWVSVWTTPAGDEAGAFLRVVIEDEARQVDTCELKGRDLDDPKPGGLGLHIIREVMDEVEYSKRTPCGMRLTMTKHAPRAGDSEQNVKREG